MTDKSKKKGASKTVCYGRTPDPKHLVWPNYTETNKDGVIRHTEQKLGKHAFKKAASVLLLESSHLLLHVHT